MACLKHGRQDYPLAKRGWRQCQMKFDGAKLGLKYDHITDAKFSILMGDTLQQYYC